MDHLLKVTLIGLVSGITGTGIGGAASFLVKRVSNRHLSFILEFSAGLMTSVVCFELIPEALNSGGAIFTLSGVLAGAASIIYAENLFRRIEFIKPGNADQSLLRTGILMAVGIALHNFPEGFAVGSGFNSSLTLGITITAVIVIHDIPEGIAMSVPMKAGGFSASKAFFFTLLSGLPVAAGAFLGALLGSISAGFISLCLGFAAGAMLYIIFGELVPESKRLYLGRLSSIGNISGIICGIIVSVIN